MLKHKDELIKGLKLKNKKSYMVSKTEKYKEELKEGDLRKNVYYAIIRVGKKGSTH